MNIYEKLLNVQLSLKAPKSQHNDFGNYYYRNCEDILESVKPLCRSIQASVIITDDIALIGDRFYVKATAMFVDTEKDCAPILVTAYAREEASKKGMDSCQVTGAASSYARKYALNGLFCIDDTKDSDASPTTQNESKPTQKTEQKSEPKPEVKQKPENISEPPKSSIPCPVCGKLVTTKFSRKLNRTISAQEQIDGAGGMCVECYDKKKNDSIS